MQIKSTIKPIHAPEEIFQFLSDSNQQRQREIQLESEVERLSRELITIILN